MGTKYHRLGDYIRPVDVRNRDLKVTELLGLSIEKKFIPSIANTIGTDMSTYKIVKPTQFAYVPVTSRNGDKITVALYEGAEPVLISQAYTVFEIIDHNALLPEYLMMWFRRPEFDRYARFHSHGSAREVFDWDELCNVMLPVPDIDRQREIVAEYETLTNRIRLNEQIIQRLEATAQALYRKMFVDNIDKQNLPTGWRIGTLGEICEIKYGKAHEHIPDGNIPIYGSGGIMRYGNKAIYTSESVLIPRKGSLNNILIINEPFWTVDTMFYSVAKMDYAMKYLYYVLRQYDFLSLDTGSAVPSMTTDFLYRIETIIPSEDTLKLFDENLDIIFKNILTYKKENTKLTEFLSLLLAKMGK